MSAKRALKLDTAKDDNPPDATPQKTKKKNQNFYSPTTGTCQMSPFSSPTSHNTQNPRNPPAEDGKEESDSKSGFSRRGQPAAEQDGLLDLQSRVRSSLARILKIRANLKSLQALEGSRELENILGPSDSSRSLSTELQKTQTLMSQAEELHLLKPNHGKVPAREDIDYLCVVRDLENSIKGVVQRFHKFPGHSVYTDIGYAQTAGSAAFLLSLLEPGKEPPDPLPALSSTGALAQ